MLRVITSAAVIAAIMAITAMADGVVRMDTRHGSLSCPAEATDMAPDITGVMLGAISATITTAGNEKAP
jgi:hypothetical protein